ncbi:gamma-glutamyl-gamma-aminobutyrate hydrolase family protein [Rhodoluna sp.]|jgi:para-aminobenzoate synthetase component 2|uniref:anthranilate synthase component II n=1 Tax=Rhodoluna sp. TaxID=1969481 RepID=UPI0025E04FFC|nr:gamma-glutamyl-gamma-aminobutyrate hydrolase family protein [Rhodoluna sp.]
MVKILVLDNYDSFVYTLNGYLQQLGAETEVLRNDVVTEAELPGLLAKYDAVLLSPGPGTPADAGLSIPVVKLALQSGQPVFGVCLGHQAIAEAMGATVTSAEELMHGKTSLVNHDDSLIFKDVAEPFTATRYHSLAVVDSTVPADLLVTARTAPTETSKGGVIMALQHKSKPIYGVQYHPESVLTQHGYQMLGNWLESIGLNGAAERAKDLSPLVNLS